MECPAQRLVEFVLVRERTTAGRQWDRSAGPRQTLPAQPSTQPRDSYKTRHITVVEQVCTLEACSHCCRCHLRHTNNGYGRCMKRASAPWPECECAGKCDAGRCAQPECVSNHILIDRADTQCDPQSHNDHSRTGVSVVSLPSTPPPSLPGVRRAAGGVHVDEEVLC